MPASARPRQRPLQLNQLSRLLHETKCTFMQVYALLFTLPMTTTILSKRKKRSKGVLPIYRSAVVPAAETLYGQTIRSFPADPSQPVAFVAFGQHARNESLINSSPNSAVAAACPPKPWRRRKV